MPRCDDLIACSTLICGSDAMVISWAAISVVFLVVAGGQQVDQRMGQRIGLAAFAGRDQREGDVAEEVGQAFLVDVAGIVPGAAVPDAGLAGGNFRPPLVAGHADVVLLGDAGGDAHRRRTGRSGSSPPCRRRACRLLP